MFITMCTRSSYQFFIVTYCIKWVTTSWTDGITNKDPEESLMNLDKDILKSFDFYR